MSQLEIEAAALDMVEQRGRVVMDKVEQKLLTTSYDNGIIASALQHYAKSNLPLVLPLFPALISLSYEAVTGSQETGEFESVATAMMLIAFSADIHDDIIDQSTVKYAKKTIYGKFGSEIALLAGDALLIQGHALLHQACEVFSPKQRQALSVLIPKALFELSAAEVLERQLSKKPVIVPDKYFEIMRLKGVFAELQCRIGGIIGQANDETLDAIASYGRIIGMLGTIKDEFSDVSNISELEHRIKFECPPLPMVYAIQNAKVKVALKELVTQLDSKVASKKVVKLVLESEGVCELKHKINEYVSKNLKDWVLTRKNRAGTDASLLFQAFSL
ncbi:MAG: polyprenyl synthetase family protein [Nitrososphaerota archaeon]|jgi:geranylgeranyl pyrophosphate synthase|nr:polyprenyl synthetase family protein [Nitrososphaerota archaeon]